MACRCSDTGGVPPARGDGCKADRYARKANTPFRQDGLAARAPSGTPGGSFGFPHGGAGFWTPCSAERVHEDAGVARDERHRVHSCIVRSFCAVRGDASNSKRTGGGKVTTNTGINRWFAFYQAKH